MVSREEKVKRYYEQPEMKEWWNTNKTLSFHYGYYEKGYRNHTDAIFHMNDVVWGLLGLDGTKPHNVLDSGCGIGGTSIYLAKKYPFVRFTGINITGSETHLAARLAQDHQVAANTCFFEQNYCTTSFADNSFDGIFALESINYARDTDEFIIEMHRVLKPGGKLVIMDGFRTKKKFSTFMEISYHHWLSGRAIDDLVYIDDCARLLASHHFKEVTTNDISSHTAPSQIRGVIIGLPFFFSLLLKAVVSLNRYKRSDDSFFMGVSFCGGLLSVGGYTKYYAVTATKQ